MQVLPGGSDHVPEPLLGVSGLGAAKGGVSFEQHCGHGPILQEVADKEGQDGQGKCLNTDSIARLLFWGLLRLR